MIDDREAKLGNLRKILFSQHTVMMTRDQNGSESTTRMRQTPPNSGLIRKESLLFLVIVVICAAIIAPLWMRMQGQNLFLTESGRMRRLYVAMAMYGEVSNSQPPPNLTAIFGLGVGRENYLSERDPFADLKADSFPADPGLENGERSPVRISFSYLWDFRRAGKIKTKPWAELQFDTTTGILADEWLGSVQPGKPFEAQVSGQVIRINMDGSVFRLKDRGGPKPLGDPQDLFIKR